MTFAGAKFLLLVITALTFIAVTGLVFLGFYNLFLSRDSSQEVMVTVMVIALIAGGAASYLG
jgi:cytochrome b subunit of formate dehydrogenase